MFTNLSTRLNTLWQRSLADSLTAIASMKGPCHSEELVGAPDLLELAILKGLQSNILETEIQSAAVKAGPAN